MKYIFIIENKEEFEYICQYLDEKGYRWASDAPMTETPLATLTEIEILNYRITLEEFGTKEIVFSDWEETPLMPSSDITWHKVKEWMTDERIEW